MLCSKNKLCTSKSQIVMYLYPSGMSGKERKAIRFYKRKYIGVKWFFSQSHLTTTNCKLDGSDT